MYSTMFHSTFWGVGESLERENTFCTITFQKCKKIKKINLVSTLLNEIYPKMH